MKKTLNTTEIENQLAGSVFFRKNRQEVLPVNQQTSEEANQQGSKEVNQEVRKSVSQQTTKPTNTQTSQPLKKFASYLAEETFYALKTLAIQMRKKDYEVLQEAVEEYIKKKKGS